MMRSTTTTTGRRWFAGLLVLAAILAVELYAFGPAPAAAQANVTIAPTRLVFEGRDRSAELILLNRGNEEVTYRISLIAMRMSDEGKLVRVEKPAEGQKIAHDLLRFAPRQIRLKPGKAQRVRVMVRKPAELEEGEYRSHMLFQAIPEASKAPSADDDSDDQLTLRLNILSGLSIPLIVRHGDLSVDTKITDLEHIEPDKKDQPHRLTFRLRRDGGRSVYGDITATFVPKGDGKKVVIAKYQGAAIYTPNEARDAQLIVSPPKGLSLEKGKIVVTYRERSEDGGALLASEELVLP